MSHSSLSGDYFAPADHNYLRSIYDLYVKKEPGGQQGFAREADVSQGAVSGLFGGDRAGDVGHKSARPRPANLAKIIRALRNRLRQAEIEEHTRAEHLCTLDEISQRVVRALPSGGDEPLPRPGEVVPPNSPCYIMRQVDQYLDYEIPNARRSTIQICGAPGMGKNSVMRRFLSQLKRRGVRVARVERGGESTPTKQTDLFRNIVNAACRGWELPIPDESEIKEATAGLGRLAGWLSSRLPRAHPCVIGFESVHAVEKELVADDGSRVSGPREVFDLIRAFSGVRAGCDHAPGVIYTVEPSLLDKSGFKAWIFSSTTGKRLIPQLLSRSQATEVSRVIARSSSLSPQDIDELVEALGGDKGVWPQLLHMTIDAAIHARSARPNAGELSTHPEAATLGMLLRDVGKRWRNLPLDSREARKLRLFLDGLPYRMAEQAVPGGDSLGDSLFDDYGETALWYSIRHHLQSC